MRFKAAAFCILTIISSVGFGHPVPYEGSTGVMMWQTPIVSDQWITHSLTSDFALAGRFTQYRLLDEKRSFQGLQANYLLKRWNGIDYQGNIYLYLGGGQLDLDGEQQSAALGGWEADWESRKYFVFAKGETIRGRDDDVIASRHEFRVGVAPYPSGYEELATWFIIQASQDTWMNPNDWEITPLVRFYYKNVLWEQGVSLDGNWMFNLMFHL